MPDSTDTPKVFISYSHKDEEWKDRLVTHLGVLEIPVWDDRKISAGDEWLDKIITAIESANIAILMISAHFLTSDFIISEEVPKLLERRAKEGLKIIPLIIKPCAWEQVGWLSPIQARPKNCIALSVKNDPQIDMILSAFTTEINHLLTGRPASQKAQTTIAIRQELKSFPLQCANGAYLHFDLDRSTVTRYFSRCNEEAVLPNPEQELLTNNVRYIIHGKPGAGKTILLKRLARLALVRNELPIYLELGKFNDHPKNNNTPGNERFKSWLIKTYNQCKENENENELYDPIYSSKVSKVHWLLDELEAVEDWGAIANWVEFCQPQGSITLCSSTRAVEKYFPDFTYATLQPLDTDGVVEMQNNLRQEMENRGYKPHPKMNLYSQDWINLCSGDPLMLSMSRFFYNKAQNGSFEPTPFRLITLWIQELLQHPLSVTPQPKTLAALHCLTKAWIYNNKLNAGTVQLMPDELFVALTASEQRLIDMLAESRAFQPHDLFTFVVAAWLELNGKDSYFDSWPHDLRLSAVVALGNSALMNNMEESRQAVAERLIIESSNQRPTGIRRLRQIRALSFLPDDRSNYKKESYWAELMTTDNSAFFMARQLVTNANYAEFMQNGGYTTPFYWSKTEQGKVIFEQLIRREPAYWWDSKWNAPNQPVVGISWYEANAYCVWLQDHLCTEGIKADNFQVSLPTWQQWLIAVKSHHHGDYPWGSATPDEEKINYNWNIEGSTPVGIYSAGKTANEIYDLFGNVWEWGEDMAKPGKANQGKIFGGGWGCGDKLFEGDVVAKALSRAANDWFTGFRCVGVYSSTDKYSKKAIR